MNASKKKYAKQCKIKTVTFYKCDDELLDFANSINFQKEVKDFLRRFKREAEKYGTYKNDQ